MLSSKAAEELIEDQKHEDFEKKYNELVEEYMAARQRNGDLKDELVKRQERNIQREHEYRHVIDDLQTKIRDNSTRPLDDFQPKSDDAYLLEGIDLNDKEQAKQIRKLEEIQRKNQEFMEGTNCNKHIKDLHQAHEAILQELDNVQEQIGKHLRDNRDKILLEFDKKVSEIKDQLKRESEKQKDDQYDFKLKEKELNDHLDTMTQVAQKIDEDNQVLMKKYQELKIQYLSQKEEEGSDNKLLLKQIIFHKK
jgi:hypothetical protein